MKVNRPKRTGYGGRYAGVESRFLHVHVWQGTFAAWSFAFRIGHPWRTVFGIPLRWWAQAWWGKPWK